MFNRTLRRPMFRRGGKAEGGITSGLRRQGYDGTDGKQNVIKNDFEKVTTQRDLIDKLSPRYNNQGSDFFMGLGANILAAPGGNPILQTLGTAAREPLAQMAKTNMANVSGKREVAMAMWNNMDEDTKTRMMKDAKSRIDNGVFDHIPEDQRMKAALEAELYSKGKSPEAAKAARIKELESSRSLDTMDEVAYRDLESREKQLESTLSSAQDINDNHQRYNGKLQTKLTEVEEDNRKLSLQINDYIKKYQDSIRKSGL